MSQQKLHGKISTDSDLELYYNLLSEPMVPGTRWATAAPKMAITNVPSSTHAGYGRQNALPTRAQVTSPPRLQRCSAARSTRLRSLRTPP